MSEDDYLHGVDVGIDLYIDRAHKAEALAASRKELLREIKEMLGYCPFCWAHLKDPCDSGCKMGKELGDD